MSTTIMLLEDDLLLGSIIKLGFAAQRPDWKVIHVKTCAEAKALIGTQAVCAAVLDMYLPDGNGLDIIPELKKLSPRTPVVVISGAEPEEAARESKAAGADEFVPKPFDVYRLMFRVDDALQKRWAAPERAKTA